METQLNKNPQDFFMLAAIGRSAKHNIPILGVFDWVSTGRPFAL